MYDYDDIDSAFSDLERASDDEREAQEKAMVLSIVQAIRALWEATTDANQELERCDAQELERCDQICAAIIAFAFKGRLEPLPSHEDARAAWFAAWEEFWEELEHHGRPDC